MSIVKDYDIVIARIHNAIIDAVETDVADAAQSAVGEALGGWDFPRSRGEHGGGLLDPRSLETTIDTSGDTITLIVRNIAPFQGTEPRRDITLSEVVVEGIREFNMPGPRPYIDVAQADLDAGRAEQALVQGLRRRGITVR